MLILQVLVQSTNYERGSFKDKEDIYSLIVIL